MERLSSRILRLYATVNQLEDIGVSNMNTILDGDPYASTDSEESRFPFVQAFCYENEYLALCDKIMEFARPIRHRLSDGGSVIHKFATKHNCVVEVIAYDRL